MSLRAAIAGTGFIGAVHAHAVRAAGGTLAGVLASSPQSGAEAARRLGAERVFAGPEELATAPDVDVVHVCTPNHLHDGLAALALEAGKHVVCEKPLAVDLPRAERLAAVAGSAPGQVAAVPFVYRYYPTVHEARRRIASGEAGAVHLVHGTYLQDWLLTADDANWRVDAALGGRVAGLRRHRLALVRPGRVRHRPPHRAPVGAHADRRAAPPRRAGGRAFDRPGGDGPARAVDTEDAAVVQFETDGGALGSVVVSQVSAGRKNRLWLEVDAAREAVAFDQEDAETLWCGGRDASTLVRRDPGVMTGSAARLAVLPPGPPPGLPGLLRPLRRRRGRGGHDRRRAGRDGRLRRRPARRPDHRRRAALGGRPGVGRGAGGPAGWRWRREARPPHRLHARAAARGDRGVRRRSGLRGARGGGLALARRPALHRQPHRGRRLRRGRGRAGAPGARRQRADPLGARLLRQQPPPRPRRARGRPRPPAPLHRRGGGPRGRPGRHLRRARPGALRRREPPRGRARAAPARSTTPAPAGCG